MLRFHYKFLSSVLNFRDFLQEVKIQILAFIICSLVSSVQYVLNLSFAKPNFVYINEINTFDSLMTKLSHK